MAFCPNCGTQNEDGAKFCANCASQLTPDTQNDGFGYNAGGFTAPAVAPAKKINIISLIGTLVILIAMFLPYYSVKALGMSESANFFKLGWEESWFLCLMCIILVVAALLLNLVKMSKGALVPLALFLIFYIILAIITGKDAAANGVTSGSIMGITVKAGFGFGFWLTWIALVVSVVAPFLDKFIKKAPKTTDNFSDTQQF